MILIVLLLMFVANISVHAEEKVLLSTIEEVDIKETESSTSKTILTIPQGTMVVAEDTNGEWVKVMYNQKEGFVLKDKLAEQTLKQEVSDELEEQNRIVAMEYEEQLMLKKQKLVSIVVGIIIGTCIIGMFAIGILNAVKKNKEAEIKLQDNKYTNLKKE